MLNQSLLPELQQEASSTLKMIERVPFDKWDWKPHEKSMSLGQLANHVVDLMNWVPFTLSSKEIDWASFKYKGFEAEGAAHLVEGMKKNTEGALAAMGDATDEQLMAPWTMRSGETVFFTMPRVAVIRTYAMNHLVHHRGQLSVYLRLLDVPVPGMYGPTADES